uniref:Ankyrin repeat and SOCS box protein 1 n=1 Tax=Bos mutus grunniens TaxID=30521 RepID=A0A8B9YMI9_BOSMU
VPLSVRAEPGRCPSAVALLAPVLSSCASGFLVCGLGLLRHAWAWQGECVKVSPAAEPLEAFLTRGLPPAPCRRVLHLPAWLPVLSLSRINEKSVWCCGWLPCTPLRIAATAGHGNCVDFLIRKGAEVDLVDVKGQTALYVAVVNGHLESAQILLEAGADPNGSRHHRSTPVYHASRVGRADILKALIRYGADVDVNHHLTPDAQPPFSRRLTSLVVCPLYISAAYHNLQCFKLLLQAGANPDFNCNGPVNTQGFYRGSPGCVMDAVLRHGCEAAFVSLLVEFGANLNLVKWESLGPESRGRRKVDPEALQVFKEARSVPRSLLNLCRVAVRRALGKYRLHLIPSLPLPDPIKKFLLYE